MQEQHELGIQHSDGSGLMPEIVEGKVDARSVHEALEVASPFTHWLKRRIEEFGFVEGEDFFSADARATSTKLSTFRRGVRSDFHLTLDMAKELAMVERNECGRKMRRYFIECEKRLREVSAEQSAPGLPGSALAKIQAINTGLIEVASEHAQRIEALEANARPGDDWQTIPQWLACQGIEINCGRKAKLSALCAHRSGVLNVPVGRIRRYRTSRNGRSYPQWRPSFSPRVLEEICPPIIDRWAAKDAAAQANGNGGAA